MKYYSSRTSAVLGWCLSAIILVVWYLFSYKALDLSDEGWYMYCLRDCPSGLASGWYYIFNGLFSDVDIRMARLLCLALNIISSSVFAAGLTVYNKTRNPNNSDWGFSCALAVILAGQMSLFGNLSYNSVILQVAQTAFGLVLFALVYSKYYGLLLLLAGFFSFFVIPAKITAGLMLLVVCVALFFIFRKRLAVLFFLCGILLGLCSWFVFFQSPSGCYYTFVNNFTKTVRLADSDYGILFLLKWLINAFVWHFSLLLTGFAFVYLLKKNSRSFLYVLFLSAFALYLVASGFITFNGVKIQDPYKLLWVLAIVALLLNRNKERAIISIVFILMPLCLTFGTDNMYRYTYKFLSFIAASVLLLSESKWQKVLLAAVILLMTVNQLYNYNKGRNLLGSRYSAQVIDVSGIGINQHYKVDETDYKAYSVVKEHSKFGDSVMCDMFSWGFVPALGLNPIRSDFRIDAVSARDSLDAYISREDPLLILLYETESDFGSKKRAC